MIARPYAGLDPQRPYAPRQLPVAPALATATESPRTDAREFAPAAVRDDEPPPPLPDAVEPPPPARPPWPFDDDAPEPEPPPDANDGACAMKLTERVVQSVTANATLFHDSTQTAYAAVQSGTRRVVQRLQSSAMRAWIARTARQETGTTISKNAIEEALTTLDGIARFDCEERSVYLRVASHEGEIYVDLGDHTGACVRVTAAGWTVVDDAPVMFRRPDAMRALPRPVRGGALSELRPFVNLPDDDAHNLYAAWLVAAFRPGRPFPILALHGEQGTAKSTTSRVARSLVDPNAAPVRSAPRKEDDLAVASVHSHVVAFDNLSGVAPWLSDALCRLATGGGLSKRTLYTDDGEFVIEAIRPIVVNGIDDIANRPDLAERCLVLTLQPIPKGKRRDEGSFWRDFEIAAPRVFGVLLDGVASALRHEAHVEIADLPRMADFARWITAAEPGLGLSPGTLLVAYERNRIRVVDVALDASPVASAVRRLLDLPKHGGKWAGEPTQLLAELDSLTQDATKRQPTWPKTSGALSKALRRAATFLRSVGIALDLDGHDGRGGDKRRSYRLERAEADRDTVPTVPASPTAEKRGEGGDEVGTHRIGPSSPLQEPEDAGGDAGDDGDARGGCFADLLAGAE